MERHHAVAISMFLLSFSLVLFELVLTRLFSVVLFASFAHLALALALLGIGFGAVLQHLWPQLVPDEGLEKRVALLSLLQGATTLIAVFATVMLPVTQQFEEPPVHYGERSSVAWNLIDPMWFSVLLPILAVPFVVVGLAFAGVFQRRKEHIGLIYGADLIGGAVGAMAFLPIMAVMPVPEAVWSVGLATAASAAVLYLASENKPFAGAAGAVAAICVGMSIAAGGGMEFVKIHYAAGYSEEQVTWTEWTPLTRLAVHEDARGIHVLLDNSSASEVILTEEDRDRKARAAARALVYRLHDPPARIAILAASAGPEVAVAQKYGHANIEAVDIAAEIGDLVARRWPDSPVNPYVHGNTERVWSDGRAAILHSEEPYDIIQMVHANLHSSAGMLAHAWSPNLLETKQAFHTYFDHLSDDGTLCFAASHSTRAFLRSAYAALQERGVEDPADHFAYITGNQILMLVKKRPWTQAERDKLAGLVKRWPGKQHLTLDPLATDQGEARMAHFRVGPVMTDNRPYLDTPAQFRGAMTKAFEKLRGKDVQARASDVIYNALSIQTLFVLFAGSLLVIVPLARTGPAGLKGVSGVGWGLLYVSCLGYGYLAVETVLIHELVLFVGHPTYAVTAVIFAMLLSSGLGSILVGTLVPETLTQWLQAALGITVFLGALQAWVIPELLHTFALGLPMGVRICITIGVLAPLGFVMGMPFPLALRILRPEAAGLVPWAWAFNGWTSVVASLGTVYAARLYGYSQAFTVALAAYVLALVLAPRLAHIGSDSSQAAEAG